MRRSVLLFAFAGLLGSSAQVSDDQPQDAEEEAYSPRTIRRRQPPLHQAGAGITRNVEAALHQHHTKHHEGSNALTCSEIATAAKNCHEMRMKTTKVAVVMKKRFLAERKQRAASQAHVHRLKEQLKKVEAAKEDAEMQFRKERQNDALEKLQLDEFKTKLADSVQGETELATDLRIAQDNLANHTAEEIGGTALREQLATEHTARKAAEKKASTEEHALVASQSKFKSSDAELRSYESKIAVQTKDLSTAANEVASLKSQSKIYQEREHESEVTSKARAEMDALEVQAAQRALNHTSSDLLVAKTEVEELRISRDRALAVSSGMNKNQANDIIGLHEQVIKEGKSLQDIKEELKLKVQALNATTHDLANALEIAKEQKDMHANVSETLTRRDQEANSYSEQLSEANHELESIREELGSKDKELNAIRSKYSAVESQDKEDKENLQSAQALVKDEVFKLDAAQAELHDRDSKLGYAEANVTLEREQLHNLVEQVHHVSDKDRQTDTAILKQAKAETESLQAALDKAEMEMKALRAEARAQQAQARLVEARASEKDAERERLVLELRAAQADSARLNATQVELAKELGVSSQELQVSGAKALNEFRQMNARLSETDVELEADRAALHAKEAALNGTRNQLGNARLKASKEGMLREKLIEAEGMMGSFHAELTAHEAELNQTKVLLSSAEAEAGQLPLLRAKLTSADNDLEILRSSLAFKARELNNTRAQLGDTTRTLQSLNKTRVQLSAKLSVTKAQLQSTHEDLEAEDKKLNTTKHHLATTMDAVKDLDEMRSKLTAADKELKTYKAALSAKSNEVLATREEAEAAEKLRVANGKAAAEELKDLETMRAKIKLDGANLVAMKSKIERKEVDLRAERRDLSTEAFALRSAQLQLSEKQAEKKKLAMLKVADAGRLGQLSSELEATKAKLANKTALVNKLVAMATHDIAAQDKDKQAVDEQLQDARANITDLKEAVNRSQWYQTELLSMTSVLKQARDELDKKNNDLKVVADALVTKNGETDSNAHLLHETSERAYADEQALKKSHTDELDMKRLMQQSQEEFAAKLAAKDKEMAKDRVQVASEARTEIAAVDHKLKSVESEDGAKFRAAKVVLEEERGAQAKLAFFHSKASKAEGEVKEATTLLKRDEDLLRNSYAKQDRLKKAIATKYGKMARDLKKEKHHESELAKENQALEKKVRYLRAQAD